MKPIHGAGRSAASCSAPAPASAGGFSTSAGKPGAGRELRLAQVLDRRAGDHQRLDVATPRAARRRSAWLLGRAPRAAAMRGDPLAATGHRIGDRGEHDLVGPRERRDVAELGEAPAADEPDPKRAARSPPPPRSPAERVGDDAPAIAAQAAVR